MTAHSRRLGKGLGALFPTLPGEESDRSSDTEHAENANRTAPSVVGGMVTGGGVGERPSESFEGGGDGHGVRVSGPAVEAVASRADGADGPLDNADDSGAGIARNVKRGGRRPTMPSLADSIPHHPADMFFGDDGALAGAASRVHHQDGDTEGDSLKAVHGGYLAELRLTDIIPNRKQPRTVFDEEDLDELSRSIQEVGVLQPVVVRKRSREDMRQHEPESGYELIMGERRWRASQRAGLATIPAIVRTTSDGEMLREALLENLHRVALNPLEEAAAYQQMMQEFGITQAELSKSISKSRPQIANTLRLLQLPASVQKKVASGVLSAGHARALLSLGDAERMEALANRIIAEGLSVRTTEEIVSMQAAKDSGRKKKASKANPWADSDAVHRLEDRFDTKVMIRGTKKRGKIEINFASEEDLNRILQLLDSGKLPGGPDADAQSDGWV